MYVYICICICIYIYIYIYIYICKRQPYTQVYRTQRNSKKELEKELKHACEALILLCAAQIAGPKILNKP